MTMKCERVPRLPMQDGGRSTVDRWQIGGRWVVEARTTVPAFLTYAACLVSHPAGLKRGLMHRLESITRLLELLGRHVVGRPCCTAANGEQAGGHRQSGFRSIRDTLACRMRKRDEINVSAAANARAVTRRSFSTSFDEYLFGPCLTESRTGRDVGGRRTFPAVILMQPASA